MRQALVALEVTLLAEADAASLARVRLLAGVDALVPGEVVLHAECLAAHVARVAPLARVHGQVAQHLLPPAEPLSAVGAPVRILVRVRSAMYVQGRLRPERLAARVTHVRPLASVDAPMVLHRVLHREAAAAYVARVVLHALVHVPEVVVQAAALDELFAAYVARVRLLARVGARVRPVAFPRAEPLAATLADQHRAAGGSPRTRVGLARPSDRGFSLHVALRGICARPPGRIFLPLVSLLLVGDRFLRRRKRFFGGRRVVEVRVIITRMEVDGVTVGGVVRKRRETL